MRVSTNNTVLPESAQKDEYELLRAKIYEMITGGTLYDPQDPDISFIIDALDASVKKYWESMETGFGYTDC